jgi:hypothetical protein
MQESNLRFWFKRPLFYHWTNRISGWLELNQYLLYPKQTHYLYATPFLQAVGLEPTTTVLKTIVLPLKLCLSFSLLGKEPMQTYLPTYLNYLSTGSRTLKAVGQKVLQTARQGLNNGFGDRCSTIELVMPQGKKLYFLFLLLERIY